MTDKPSIRPQPPLPSHKVDDFVLYHYVNPATNCEYPHLASNEARTILLSFGQHSFCFDFDADIPKAAERWLTADYTPTPERLQLSVTALKDMIEKTFPGLGQVSFGYLNYAADLSLVGFDFSLWDHKTVTEFEYVILENGEYERWYRPHPRRSAVGDKERALLDFCRTAFAPLPDKYSHLIAAPTTPRYRRTSQLV